MTNPAPSRTLVRWTHLSCAMLLALAGRADAQTVAGRVLAATDRQPIPHVLVVALDEEGRQRRGVLSDSAGRFALRLPAPGRYSIHAERIGYESATSAPLSIGAGLHPYDVVLSERPFALEGIRAEVGGRGCAPRRDGDAVHQLWTEIQKALRLELFTRTETALSYTTMSYERELDPRLAQLQREQQTYRTSRAVVPFTALPATELLSHGFSRPAGAATDLFGVDAAVLLSREFLDHYCFRLATSSQRTLIGLGFTPIRRRNLTDVRGVLWVDRASAELRYLTYDYLRLPPHLEPFGARAEVHFRRLSTGLWVIDRWWIRVPRVATTAPPSQRQSRRGAYRLLGYRENGGVLLAAEADGRAAFQLIGGAAIAGRVTGRPHDSARGPATVFLTGTPHTTTADSAGEFRIEGVPAGRYAIAARDSLLDELRMPVRLDTMRLTTGRTTVHHVVWPTQREILRALCPSQEEERGEQNHGLIFGDVLDPETAQPLAGVEVRVDWRAAHVDDIVNRWRFARTDQDGRYYLCWVARNTALSVRVAADGSTRSLELNLTAPIQRVDVR